MLLDEDDTILSDCVQLERLSYELEELQTRFDSLATSLKEVQIDFFHIARHLKEMQECIHALK